MKIRLGIPTGKSPGVDRAAACLRRPASTEARARMWPPRVTLRSSACSSAPRRWLLRFHGVLDAGLTGLDWVLESGLEVTNCRRACLRQQSRGKGALGPGRSRRLALRCPGDLAAAPWPRSSWVSRGATSTSWPCLSKWSSRGRDRVKAAGAGRRHLEATETGSSRAPTVCACSTPCWSPPSAHREPGFLGRRRPARQDPGPRPDARWRPRGPRPGRLMLNVRRDDLDGVLACCRPAQAHHRGSQ